MQMTNSEKPANPCDSTHTHTHTFVLTNSFFKGNPFHSGNGCNRGISLIALIITIIVIIILAAISIAGVSGVVERSRYAKFCGDLDAVQEAVSQAYGNKQVSQSLENPTNRKSKEEIYEWVGNGAFLSHYERKGMLLDDCVEIVDGTNLGIDLPKYGDSKWYIDVGTGEVFLGPGIEYENKIYANKTDIQNGGADKPTDYTGYYVDVDDDGEIDGVVFADLAIGGSGQLTDSEAKYSIPAKPISSLKEYEVSENTVHGAFGDKFVISPVESTENVGKKDRFYVMALNAETSSYYWYYNASCYDQASNQAGEPNAFDGAGKDAWKIITSIAFGAGKRNTEKMIEKWNSGAYGKKDDNDLWGHIQEKVKAGWFVPSEEEMVAYGAFESAESIFNSRGDFWSSSLANFSETYGECVWCWQYPQLRIVRSWIPTDHSVYLVTTY